MCVTFVVVILDKYAKTAGLELNHGSVVDVYVLVSFFHSKIPEV